MRPPHDEEDTRELYRMEPVRIQHCEANYNHYPHEKTWHQTDPSGKQESFVRIDYCPGTATVVDERV